MSTSVSYLKRIFRRTYKTWFSKYDVIIEKECAGLKNLLDVGCGSNSPVHTFSKKIYCVGVDAFAPSIEASRQKGIHREYYQMNVLEIDKNFDPKSFDCVLALDVIEHQKKEDGFQLLEKMERLARKKVIVFTPNGFVEQGDRFSNPWQVHLSGWNADEFRKRGYKVIGVNGYKSLRGQYAKVKYKPVPFWNFISDITELFVKAKPDQAYQLLAIKEF
ncbi:MAG: class I SAM-dependent methyltransferase [Chitinophagales bacterium]|nr:class I SAM-dependent methyltransferase [Chitinophagales bacterium]